MSWPRSWGSAARRCGRRSGGWRTPGCSWSSRRWGRGWRGSTSVPSARRSLPGRRWRSRRSKRSARTNERDVSSLRRRIEEQTAAKEAGDFDGFFAADDAMHAEVFRLAGFPRLWDLVWRVKADLDRLRRLSAPDAATIEELIDEHTAIVDHVEAGDGPRATTVLRRHAARILELQPQLAAAHPDYFAD